MELTYEEYTSLGGTCPESLFERCKLTAEDIIAQMESTFDVIYNSSNSEKLLLISLIDDSFVAYNNLQAGGNISSIKVGSYSESRQIDGSASSSSDRSLAIFRQYAKLRLRKIGVLA